mmetsp:Transcript_66905/g.168960  ORF Transcript_66905/g.168960 Transcript_66905/m.168960 type:complete len:224 (+) Transcript_66905:494-1165(+)
MVLRNRPGTRPRKSKPPRAASANKEIEECPQKFPLCLWLLTTSRGQIVSQARLEHSAPVQKGLRPPGINGGTKSRYTEKAQKRPAFRVIVTAEPLNNVLTLHVCSTWCETFTRSNGASMTPRATPPAKPATTTCQSKTPKISCLGVCCFKCRSATSYTPNCADRNSVPPKNTGIPPRYKPRTPCERTSSSPMRHVQEDNASGRACILVFTVSNGCPTTTEVSP